MKDKLKEEHPKLHLLFERVMEFLDHDAARADADEHPEESPGFGSEWSLWIRLNELRKSVNGTDFAEIPQHRFSTRLAIVRIEFLHVGHGSKVG